MNSQHNPVASRFSTAS